MNEIELKSKVQRFNDNELEHIYFLINKDPHYGITNKEKFCLLTASEIDRKNHLFSIVKAELELRTRKTLENYYKKLSNSNLATLLSGTEYLN